MSSPDKCPNCGSPAVSRRFGEVDYQCATLQGRAKLYVSDLCRERTARIKAETELAQAKRELEEMKRKEKVLVECAQEIQRKLDLSESRVRELEGLVVAFKRMFARQRDNDDPLGAKCVFCGYNGPGYWQAGTHDKSCPWHSIGGRDERRSQLATKTIGEAMPGGGK